MTKTDDDYFADWEAQTLGFGYGTGQMHLIPVVRAFLSAVEPLGQYSHEKLEAALGPVVAWLLITILCNAKILDYGTSTRYGWLTPAGQAMRTFVASRTDDQLYELSTRDGDYVRCGPDFCNCEGTPCDNPFWRSRRT